MTRIAILAYGSLIENPGKELCPLICERIEDVETPFSVEFVRSSRSRDGGPTLVPVEIGGARVKGVLLVLEATVDRAQAEDLLWRRETRNESSEKHYCRPTKPSLNCVLVECAENLAGIKMVLFTKIGANINIKKRTPEHLANLAICSARRGAGAKKMDGISYLASVIRQGIKTPLLPEYKAAILRKTRAGNLDAALRAAADRQGVSFN